MNIFSKVYNIAYNMTENSNLIIPQSEKNGALWLGNYKATLDLDFLVSNNISVVVNCTPDIPYIYEVLDSSEMVNLRQLETFRIPVFDSLLDKDIYLMEQYYHIVLPFILKKLLKEKKNIIINCHAGRQRSASVVALVLYILIDNNLMSYDKLPSKLNNKPKLMRSIIQYIQKERPQAFSFGMRVNFKKSLENFLHIEF
jgi:protein-tyrosine phosphatase